MSHIRTYTYIQYIHMYVPEGILCEVLGSYLVHILNENLLGCLRLNIRLIRYQLHIPHAHHLIHTVLCIYIATYLGKPLVASLLVG